MEINSLAVPLGALALLPIAPILAFVFEAEAA